MTILVTGANGQLGNEMRIVSKGTNDKYIFTDVCEEHFESIEMLLKLAGEGIDTSTTNLDITNLDEFNEMLKEIWASKWVTNMGQFHKQLEKALCEYLKVPYISLFTNDTLQGADLKFCSLEIIH